MSDGSTPTIRDLDPSHIRSILARNYIGRFACADGADMEIQPVAYVHADGGIYGRTVRGGLLERAREKGLRIAFQVDEVESMFHWRSVVVHGEVSILDEAGEERDRAISLLRRLDGRAFTPEDPVPLRSSVFRIAMDQVTGRAME
jgi:uncharacterized protein